MVDWTNRWQDWSFPWKLRSTSRWVFVVFWKFEFLLDFKNWTSFWKHAYDDREVAEIVSNSPQFNEYTVLALYAYQPENEEDLAFQEGEQITIIEEIDENWLRGRNNVMQEGLFPANYVEKV